MVTAEPLATTPTAVQQHPTAPTTIEEAGLNIDLVLQLALKTLFFAGQLTGNELAARLKDELGVKQVAQAHCTGHLAFKVLMAAYGSDFIQAGRKTPPSVGCQKHA